MKRRDSLLVAVWAAGAFALSLCLMSTASLTAENGRAQAEQIQTPTLAMGNIRVTAEWADANNPFGAEKPVLLVTAVNTSDADAAETCKVAVMVESPATRGSRSPSIPAKLYGEDLSISLKGKEKKVIEVKLTNKPKQGYGYVILQHGDKAETSVASASFSLPVTVNGAVVANANLVVMDAQVLQQAANRQRVLTK